MQSTKLEKKIPLWYPISCYWMVCACAWITDVTSGAILHFCARHRNQQIFAPPQYVCVEGVSRRPQAERDVRVSSSFRKFARQPVQTGRFFANDFLYFLTSVASVFFSGGQAAVDLQQGTKFSDNNPLPFTSHPSRRQFICVSDLLKPVMRGKLKAIHTWWTWWRRRDAHTSLRARCNKLWINVS